MAPKKKISKDEILKAVIELVRKNGESAINARAVANYLNCSTQPIFSNFQTMEELRSETIIEAFKMYSDFLLCEAERGEHPKYKSFGMAYIRFAVEERELFKLLFMRDRTGEDMSPTHDFNESVEYIMKASGLSKEKATLMHLEVWTSVHGIAVMLATSFLKLDWALISNILSDIYQGIKARHLMESSNECN